MKKNTKFLALIFIAVLGFNLNACNTIDGAGKDIENAGEAVQDSSN